MSRRVRVLLLALLVVAAFGGRLVHLGWGLPEVHEEATPVREAVEFWGHPGSGLDLNPGFFKYPSLTFYLQFLVQAGRYLGMSLAGRVESLDDYRQFLDQNLGAVVYDGRLLQALLGALLVLPTFALGRRLAGDRAGWLAALLVALLPLAVRESRLVGPDAALALFAGLALVAASDIARRGDRGAYVRAGLWLGLAASAKYPGALLVAPILVAHAQRASTRREGPAGMLLSPLLAQTAIVAALVFAATSPFVILDAKNALADFRYEQRHMALGHLGREEGRAILYYLRTALGAAWTWPVAAAAALGGALLAVRRSSRGAALSGVVFGLVFLGVLGTWKMAAGRYLLPLASPVAAWAAAAVVLTAERIPARGRPLVLGGLGALLLAAPAWTASAIVTGQGREDSRRAAEAWIEANVPAGSAILVERYGPAPDPARYIVMDLPLHGVTPNIYAPAYSPSLYATFDVVALSSEVGDRFLAHPREYPAQTAFYAALERGFERAAVFAAGEYTGPTITLLRRRPDSTLRELSDIPQSFFDGLKGNRPMAEYLARLGAALARQKRGDLGYRLLTAATGMDAGNPRVWGVLGAVEVTDGRYEDALLALRRARELDPDNAEYAYNLGTLFARMGELSQAADAHRRAIALDPSLEEAYIALAHALVEDVRYAEARVVLDEFVRRFPRSPRRGDAEAALAELARMGPGRP